MIEHNLRKVVMNPTDGSLHCVEHGLLGEDETADVFARAGLSAKTAAGVGHPRLARLIDWFVTRGRPKCRVLS